MIKRKKVNRLEVGRVEEEESGVGDRQNKMVELERRDDLQKVYKRMIENKGEKYRLRI